ncbi:family 20 glycosylhydrolase [Cecembia calidifontis]|jgi:hexosaminidase|uniref:beta-N-acetylhexosaminidase n=1 Tax=Cecembia calidifontis TaxID=1187080 RepID=A0A4Q7PCY6_9BACT|nr:family 20 glycosylhydrolase [Cecembia calidifontis]RZS98211.1 hexosaminidase [Cecembia calidifontis]
MLRPFLSIFLVLSFLGCVSEVKHVNPDEIHLHWELLDNKVDPRPSHQAKFTLANKGKYEMLPNWEIYFNTIFLSLQPEILSGEVEIEQLSGDFFRMRPKKEFPVLKPGDQYEIIYQSGNFLTKNSHVPDGVYIVFGEQEVGYVLENYSTKAFTLEDQLKAVDGKPFPIPTAAYLFEQNINTRLLDPKSISPFLPSPKAYQWKEGDLVLKGDVGIDAGAFQDATEFFAKQLSPYFQVKIQEGNSNPAAIKVRKSKTDLGKEGYRLDVGEQIVIEASQEQGAFYAFQSLLALLPVDFFEGNQTELRFNKISIQDAPRFEHRGLFLDVARNFQTKKAVLKLLDLMAFYKLNVFHLNLANDEGWRIEIPGLPELTEVGSKRGHSKEEKDFLWPYYGSGPDKDLSPNGSGFYTVEDFKEILRYAKERHIEVIPEIGVPAHSRAAILAMRKRYQTKMAAGDEAGAREFLLEDFGDQSVYLSAQNFRGNTICICQESAFTFYEKVIDEILAMYAASGVPIQTFHTGGDEVPRGVWEGSPICQKFIAEHADLRHVHDLPNYFYTRISKMFQEKGIQTAGWEEIGQMEVEEKGKRTARPNPVFADAGFRVYAWNAVAGWGGEDMAYQLANAGYEVIICNSSNIYFDLAYNLDPDEPGHEWSGYVDLKAAWRMVPLNNFISNDTDMYGNPIDHKVLAKGKAKLSAEGKKNIKGIQGQLWTETVKGQQMMEYYLLPKMLGLVERAWAPDPAWTSMEDDAKRLKAREEDWNRFANVVGQKELPRLDYLFGGVNTRLPKPGILIKDGYLFANVETPGLLIRYTDDGSEPKADSPVYISELPYNQNIKLKVFTSSTK